MANTTKRGKVPLRNLGKYPLAVPATGRIWHKYCAVYHTFACDCTKNPLNISQRTTYPELPWMGHEEVTGKTLPEFIKHTVPVRCISLVSTFRDLYAQAHEYNTKVQNGQEINMIKLLTPLSNEKISAERMIEVINIQQIDARAMGEISGYMGRRGVTREDAIQLNISEPVMNNLKAAYALKVLVLYIHNIEKSSSLFKASNGLNHYLKDIVKKHWVHKKWRGKTVVPRRISRPVAMMPRATTALVLR